MLSRIFRPQATSNIVKSTTRLYSGPSKFDFQPSPPRLPKEQQEEFEKLQSIANSQIAIEEYNDQVAKNEGEQIEFKAPIVDSQIGSFANLKIIPEFEGSVNPKTGEVNGPKQDPLKHTKDEWSFNGRVIDF
ncbi:Protein FMP21, mitochondrial [Candida maltosa Xu316]|uniref:Succinate dehydrogenase assembly factor 4, mitochondrial n=1 Tax=Candida maltosa (strain Xu316) TaxID=1245528 RepID=M3HSU6_CANMX|nr:Protein FMP21, mitochondrial [Candida maltosa Xu316]